MNVTNPFYDPLKLHHTPTGFQNINPMSHSKAELRLWQKERRKEKLPKPPKAGYTGFIENNVVPVDLNGIDDRVWWLGHASVMLRVAQQYILFDPILFDRVSPLSFYGPKRKTPVPLDLSQLKAGEIHFVCISHNHYDHLDKKSIQAIFQHSPNVQFIVPLGLKSWFKKLKIENVIELDWWDEHAVEASDFKFILTPARHWSTRSLFDRNQSLWGGFVFESGKNDMFKFYFSGDSGYCDSLVEINQRLGQFDFICLPIGAYSPRWFMSNSHMDPQSAVKLYMEFGQPKTLPIHWGVFELADESLDEPPQELANALLAAGDDKNNFVPFKIGEHYCVNK